MTSQLLIVFSLAFARRQCCYMVKKLTCICTVTWCLASKSLILLIYFLAISFWKVLEAQPTNNRSVELQLMRRFQKDNLHLRLHHEAKHWEGADHFLKALPDPPYESSSLANFDDTVVPGHRSVIAKEECNILCKYYATLYPHHANSFLEGRITLIINVSKISICYLERKNTELKI